jgi:hypothetical protein
MKGRRIGSKSSDILAPKLYTIYTSAKGKELFEKALKKYYEEMNR